MNLTGPALRAFEARSHCSRPGKLSLTFAGNVAVFRSGGLVMRSGWFAFLCVFAGVAALLASVSAQENSRPGQTKPPAGLFDFNQMWSGGKAEGKGRIA